MIFAALIESFFCKYEHILAVSMVINKTLNIVVAKVQKTCETEGSVSHLVKLTQNSSKLYDKNLLQSNDHSGNCGIPRFRDFGVFLIINCWVRKHSFA